VAFAFRKTAKLMFAPLLAAGVIFSLTSGASASAIADVRSPAPALRHTVLPSRTPSEFIKEQAMSPAQLVDRWTPFIKEASRRFGVAETWIKAVMRMESGGRTLLAESQPIKSSAGALGIMQVMPDTYKDMREQYGLGADPNDPRDNVLAGTAYLRWLHEKYGYPKMFAAYNAGPGTVEAQVTGARQLPNETRAYVNGIAHILGDTSHADEFTKVASQAPVSPPQPLDPIATFTRPDGNAVAIDGATVDSVRKALPNEYYGGVQTVLAIGQKRQGVLEDLATVTSILRSHGAKI